MDKIRERFKKMMCYIGSDHIADNADYMTVEDMVKESKYQLETYYERGHSRGDMRYDDDPRVRKIWKSESEKLKRFINRYEESIL